MQAPVLFLVGPVGHGKTTAREILVRLTHQRGASCSDVIYHFLAQRNNVSVEQLKQIPKEELRPKLVEAGDFLCGTLEGIHEVAKNEEVDKEVFRHPSALIRTLYMNGYNIIDGVRRRLELEDARKHLEWNGVRSFIFHIHDPRKPLLKDNSEDLTGLADNLISNDGTESDLEIKLKLAVEQHLPGSFDGIEPIKVVDLPAPTPAAA